MRLFHYVITVEWVGDDDVLRRATRSGLSHWPEGHDRLTVYEEVLLQVMEELTGRRSATNASVLFWSLEPNERPE
ncbi:hypothetical protein [Streptomyces sp. NPDC057854]|uniref:hypothetical protein n=1 Tax=unclassified Streptomyces TaxID=2593676 RepID=UPI00369E758A